MKEYDFHDNDLFGKAMKKITAANVMYYVDAERMIRIQWNKQWIPYQKAVEIWPLEFKLD